MQTKELDRVFHALADATRRGMLEQLSRGEANITTLAEPYEISQPAVSKHLRVLEDAGLIDRSRHGREFRIRVNPGPAEDAQNWIQHYARFWRRHFDAVDDYLRQRLEDGS
jgi:DNA-binding transcriptional ArsR family regulator